MCISVEPNSAEWDPRIEVHHRKLVFILSCQLHFESIHVVVGHIRSLTFSRVFIDWEMRNGVIAISLEREFRTSKC